MDEAFIAFIAFGLVAHAHPSTPCGLSSSDYYRYFSSRISGVHLEVL